VRKGTIFRDTKKMFNVDIWKIKFKGFENFLELIIIVEAYFSTNQFSNGILNGLTTNFVDNLLFSIIPCFLIYRFSIYRSLELDD
jgi:hypothetical protein